MYRKQIDPRESWKWKFPLAKLLRIMCRDFYKEKWVIIMSLIVKYTLICQNLFGCNEQ